MQSTANIVGPLMKETGGDHYLRGRILAYVVPEH